MSYLDEKYLCGGPDILHYGSKTHKKVGGKGVLLHSAFIYSKDGIGGKRLIVADKDEAHVHITERAETIEAMFGDKAEEMKKLANDPYAEGPNIRTRAQSVGNVFGRSGWINEIPVLMLWNMPENREDLKSLVNDLGFDPNHTVLTHLYEELGLVKDFI